MLIYLLPEDLPLLHFSITIFFSKLIYQINFINFKNFKYEKDNYIVTIDRILFIM
jgi:hypothetical protein